MVSNIKPIEILQKYWGYSSFRPLQEEIVQSVLDGKDTLALLPTGGGKSICFQVPALCLEGICLVVTPLIALMKDQVEQLKSREVKAIAIFSGMSRREIDVALDNCVYGNIKLLYVSPERLKTKLFIERARRMNISLLAVDEAHCISQWGYDFRPPYLEIALFKDELAIPRLTALTASATREVREDIISKLGMKTPSIFQKSYARTNLSYSAFHLENKEQKLLEILQNVKGTSIVYVRSRKKTREVAAFLKRHGVSSDFYHAGLTGEERSVKQDQWISNHVRVMVSTNAFGMGIDKPDVRTVVHLDLPDSLEAYYQEAGRAGRDEKKSYAVALFHTRDIYELKKQSEQLVASMEQLKRTYQALANYYRLAIGSMSYASYNFLFESFVKTYDLSPQVTFKALKKLEHEGLIQLSEGFYDRSTLTFILDKQNTYKYQVANPKFDLLIKTILRLAGGEAFSNYVPLKEKELARLMKQPEPQVKKWLTYLNDQKVIDYRPASDTTQLTFLTSRLDPEKLPIDKKQLEWRKKLAIEKARAVANYMTSNTCRTAILQRYFDEKPKSTCGVCDNDLTQMRGTHGKPKVKELLEVLTTPHTFNNLRRKFNKYHEKQLMNTLRILMDDGLVKEEEGIFVKKTKYNERRT